MASTLQAFRAARLTPKITVAQRCNVKASAYKVTFVSDKGVSKDVMCDEDDYLLDAADAGGVDLPAACRGKIVQGSVAGLRHEAAAAAAASDARSFKGLILVVTGLASA